MQRNSTLPKQKRSVLSKTSQNVYLHIKDCPMRSTIKWIKLWENRSMVKFNGMQTSSDTHTCQGKGENNVSKWCTNGEIIDGSYR